MSNLTAIDLFCGCGGFSLGMKRAGFDILAAIDFNPEAVAVYKKNFPEEAYVLQKDLTKFPPKALADLIGVSNVDVVVGGPPCQGFSTVRQGDGANSGPRMIKDSRRYLYRNFLDYVKFFRPKVFVMENVRGIKSAAGGQFYTQIQHEARLIGYRVHAQTEKACELGVPQKRIRQFIIGTSFDLTDYFPGKLQPASRAVQNPTLGEAIGDLPPLEAGCGEQESLYDMALRKKHEARYGVKYLSDVLEIDLATKLTAHYARHHSDRDLRDFLKIHEGENSGQAMRRGVLFEFPYSKEVFKDRYTRQSRKGLCSTILAHLSKDGLMFIHPTQNRSLTPREAARVQSFPDWFQFPTTQMHQFRLIGNAVPPLVAEAMGLAIKGYLDKNATRTSLITCDELVVQRDHDEAKRFLLQLVKASLSNTLRTMPTDTFRKGWISISLLFPMLHPDSALDHGVKISIKGSNFSRMTGLDSRAFKRFYVQSGWPVALAPVAKEAWRRYRTGQLKDGEFYPNVAVSVLSSRTEQDNTCLLEVS